MAGRAEDIFLRIVTGGEAAIDAFIEDRVSEELFLDFKNASTQPGARKMADDDQKNLAKAISGFGNGEGGVIVWGVDARPGRDGADVAQIKRPLPDPAHFRSLLEGRLSGLTIPPHRGVRSEVLPAAAGGGYVITLIPASDAAPHQTFDAKSYHIRSGSNFEPAPHGILAALFGRRPLPELAIQMHVGMITFDSFSIVLDLQNIGRGLSRTPFVRSRVLKTANPEPNVGSYPGTRKVTIHTTHSHDVTGVLEGGGILPPGASTRMLELQLKFQKISRREGIIEYEFSCGCEIGHIRGYRLRVLIEDLLDALDAVRADPNQTFMVSRIFMDGFGPI
jgi:hypothetical protein